MRRLLKNKKGQGTTEYIVILGIVVAIAITVFWKQIGSVLSGKVSSIGQSISTAGQ